MDNTIQLYLDKEKQIKGYPITSPDRVIDEKGVNVKEQLNKSVKFKVVGEGSTVPPINGGGSYIYDDTEIRELINETNTSLDNITRNMPFVNVTIYGAKGDNITDDTEAIQKALDSEFNIFIPSKQFRINGTLSLSKTKVIICDKKSQLFFSDRDDIDCFFINCDNSIIYNMNIIGGNTWYERSDIKDTQQYNNYWNERNRSAGGKGINIYKSNNIILDGCSVRNTNLGILNQQSNNITILNSYVHNTLADGFPTYSGSCNVNIKNCMAENCGDDGFPVWSFLNGGKFKQCNNILIENCKAINIRSRAFINHGAKNVSFISNYIENCWYGIVAKGDDGDIEYNVGDAFNTKIINNTIITSDGVGTTSRLSGIWTQFAKNVKIESNIITFNQLPYDINLLIQCSDDVIINNNTFEGGKILTDKYTDTLKKSNRIDIINNKFKNSKSILCELNHIDTLQFMNNTDVNSNTSGTNINNVLVQIIDCNNATSCYNKINGKIRFANVENGIISSEQQNTIGSTNLNIMVIGTINSSDRPHNTVYIKGTTWYNPNENNYYVLLSDWTKINS